ncbi:MAG: cytochrome b5 domain-containing protein [Candidatus Pacebacteria bacterium]|nr:cytochrome b5 domain-containing protein [Candidatus Paceibacterota bacterium]
MKVIIGAILAAVVIGGGWYVMQMPTATVLAPETSQAPVVDETQGGAAGTMPEGAPAPENDMVGGDAVPTTVDSFTLAQVATHATAESCWSVVNGNVYDLTKWIPLHPGGASKIKAMCGKDATASFTGKHGGQEAPEKTLASYKIGVLAR